MYSISLVAYKINRPFPNLALRRFLIRGEEHQLPHSVSLFTVVYRKFSSPRIGPRTLGSFRLLRRETPRKRCPGGREEARGAVCYTSQLCIGAWNCGELSNVITTMCKDLGFDILALSETLKWRSDTDAIFLEQPEDGDPYSGCCICLSKRAQGAVMYSRAIGSRIAFASIRGRPVNLFAICVYDCQLLSGGVAIK